MERHHRIIRVTLAVLSTLLLLLLWGTAVAQNNESHREIVRLGGDVTIAE